MRTKTKADPDVQGLEYREVMVQTESDFYNLEALSRRGWRVVCALSVSKVLVSRPEGWID